MPRRSSIVFLSVTAHALILTGLLITSIVAPGVLPLPRDVLAFTLERVVQLPDMPIPAAKRAAPPPRASDAAPIVAPDHMPSIDPEPRAVEPPGPAVESSAGGTADLSGIGMRVAAGDGIAPATTPAREQAQVPRLHSGMTAPKKIIDSTPEYPAIARAAGVQGLVILEVTITAQGDVADARVLRSIAVLDQAALDAVRRWTYTPARLNGEPIAVVMTVTINFSLNR